MLDRQTCPSSKKHTLNLQRAHCSRAPADLLTASLLTTFALCCSGSSTCSVTAYVANPWPLWSSKTTYADSINLIITNLGSSPITQPWYLQITNPAYKSIEQVSVPITTLCLWAAVCKSVVPAASQWTLGLSGVVSSSCHRWAPCQ